MPSEFRCLSCSTLQHKNVNVVPKPWQAQHSSAQVPNDKYRDGIAPAHYRLTMQSSKPDARATFRKVKPLRFSNTRG